MANNNVIEVPSTDAFKPYRGTDEQIQAFPVLPGAVYFAYDTNKIYFDEAEGRHVMSGSGIKFVYGAALEDLVPNDELLYPFPREAIQAAYAELGKQVETYQVEDIIINADGTLYRIKRIDDEFCYCIKLLVSGSGSGGGGDSSGQFYISYNVNFPGVLAKGQDATATLTVVDMKRAKQCTLYVELYENDLAMEPFATDIVYTNQAVNAPIDITIPANKLRIGLNNIRIRAAASGRSTEVNFDGMINVVDIHMRAGNSWNWLSPISKNLTEIMFPYTITGFSDNDNFTVKATFIVDEENGGTSFTETIRNSLNGQVNIYRLFQGLNHGAHTIDVYATTEINNAEVAIDDSVMHWEVAYYDPNSDIPIIWSTYRHNTTEKNYSVINIPFMVFQVGNQMNKLTVTYFVNDEEISSEEITMSEQEPAYWEVPFYNPEETNTFIISGGDADPAVFNVYIEKDNNRDMDSIATNCILHLSATGRSNNESSLKRQAWPNGKKTIENGYIGDVQLTDFNWYNNGWVKDDDGITVLRVSNGASVFIPLTLFNGSQSRQQTYEFDFRVRNAVDYSRLINLETVYQVDGNGDYILGEDGKPLPELNELGDEKVVRVVAAGGRGAFLQYYADNKGIMCGTQEAFIGINSKANLNVRYTDDVRVKVSFVVDTTILNPSEGKALIYAYVDGVLTGVMDYDQVNTNFEQNAAGIRINSNYCDVDIYEIRAYNTALSFNQITQNWVGGSSTAIERENRYERNQAISKSGGDTTARVYLDYEEVKNSGLIPVMVFTTYDKATYPGVSLVQNELPFFKGDESIPVRVRYYDPINPEKSFHCQNVQLNVQGTSSQGYPRRNYKLKIKQATDFGTDDSNNEIEPFLFETWDGVEANKNYYYKDSDHKLKKINIGSGNAETKFCLKADYMDSSSSHNTPLANLVQLLSTKHTSFDLQHPLTQHSQNDNFSNEMNRIVNIENGGLQKTFEIDGISYTESSWTDTISGKFRTTVYGFPILCFSEDPITGAITYIGKYNFNLDKSATDSFGFTNKALNPFSEMIERSTKVETKEKNVNGETYPAKKVKQVRPGTYEEISECWELRQNQAGLSKFQDGDDFWALDADGKLTVLGTHFEARYHEPEIDPDVWWSEEANGGIEGGNEAAIPYLQNLYRLWDWIRRTDVTTNKNRTYSIFETPVYYKTLSKSYESGITYYSDTEGTEATITITQHATITAIFDTTGKNVTETISASNKPVLSEPTEVAAATKFVTQLNKIFYDEFTNDPTFHNEYYGPHTIIWDSEANDGDGSWMYGEHEVPNIAKFGISNCDEAYVSAIEVTIAEVDEGFSANLYEKFTRDSNRYRLAKFRNEFAKHLNLNYCLMYFVLTELLLLYDSRQKNMMIASFGPEEVGGEYIWYPIFYDMDTQLGVNNSGQVYWDYDEDATPDLYMQTTIPAGWDGEADVSVKSHTNVSEQEPDGNTDSIFSGNGSVLWNNIYICFLNEIKSLYREMRNKDLTEINLNLYYNTNSCDKWSEIMKNLDAYFKYIAPAIPAEGFINQSGDKAVSSYYFYCLQGDRKLNRQAFFRNRLNYMDSEWLGGDYDPRKNRATIQMRYNLNDRRNTSDQDTEEYAALNSTATYRITPYLSQYVSVRYDQTVTTPQKFKLVTGAAAEPIVVEPPQNIRSRADGGVALSQQLAYVDGPKFVSSLGDLSLHYLNEFKVEEATRLRTLKLGNEDPKYFNKGFTDLKVGSKGLLREIDISNLSELNTNLIVTGCDKLEILKCLGTSLADVSLPRGSVLRRVYLPATLESLVLIKPLVLDRIITSKANASLGNNTDGLYVENLTDKLNTNIDGSTVCKIQKYQVVDTQLGYATYNMLKYLYEVKLARAAGTILSDNNATRFLRIDVEDANWTPYKQLELDAVYDDQKAYFYRNDNCTYTEYTYSSSWNRDLLNGRLYEANGQGRSPISSLAMLDRFIADFDDPLVAYADCMFKPVQDATGSDSATTKRIPIITGKLHVQNDQDHPIKESDIANKYRAANHFPDLDITVEYVTEANRAVFVEYDAETSARKVLHTQKCDPSANDTVPVIPPQSPSRLHYDFLGWVVEDGNTDWQVAKSINNNWDTEDNGCVDPTTYNLADPTLPNHQITFVAVYSLTKYVVSYYNYDGTPFYHDGQAVTTLAIAGNYITFTELIPWRDDRYDCSLKQTWHFDGWRTSLDTEDLVDSYVDGESPVGKSYLRANKNISLYARYTQESVYAHPLTLDKLVYQYDSYSQSYGVTIKDNLGIMGKICFPKELTVNGVTGPVTSTLIPSIDQGGTNYHGPLSNRHDETNAQSSYYVPGSTDIGIYAVFFEGTEDNTANITTISESTFEGSDSLIYVDFPDSITDIGIRAFASCANLTNNELPKHVLSIGTAAFNEAWTNVPEGIELKIPASFLQGYNGRLSTWFAWIFNSVGINTVAFGSTSDRINTNLVYSLDEWSGRWFTENEQGHVQFTWYVKSSAGITESIARQWVAKWFARTVDNDPNRTVVVNVG